MTAPKAQPPVPESDLHDVLAECIDRIGESGSLAAAEPVLCAHPKLAAAVRERLAKLLRTGLLSVTARPAHPEVLGDFRLLRPLGRGGMGAVYLALQQALGREVALKVIHPELLYFPAARERFHREIEAIARLRDPGIVPIYTVGEADGVPFFVMEHIVGATLAEILAALGNRPAARLQGADLADAIARHIGAPLPEPLPDLFAGSWIDVSCRIVQRMAAAAEHAHQRGVLHRDLKPSNAMVTLDGRVLLLDFGLAATEGASELTRSGAVLGTLHYMAPEQLRCEAVDARTDVYALGATLYELLALQPAHRGDNSEALRRTILKGALRPLTSLNHAVARDVETICRKALDAQAAGRYATAAAFAADLGRFAQRRPIQARRAGWLLRLRRLVQRHPARTATALAAALAATALVLLQQQRAVALAESDANLASALHAIERLTGQAKDRRLEMVPGIDTLRVQQLDEAVLLLGKLRQRRDTGPTVRLALARGLLDAGELRQQFGRPEAAHAAVLDATALLQQLQREAPTTPDLQRDLARASCLHAGLLREAGELDAAAAACETTLTLVADLPDNDKHALALRATATTDLALLEQAAGNLTGAEERLRAALAIDRVRLQLDPSPQARIDAGRTRNNLAALLLRRGDAEAALAELSALRDQQTQYLSSAPNDPELRREHARTGVAIARSHAGKAEFDLAQRCVGESLAAFEQLVTDFPQRMRYAWDRNMVQFEVAQIAAQAGDVQTARSAFTSALARHEQLRGVLPQQPELASEAAFMAGQFATLMQAQGENDAATELLQKAIVLQEQPLALKPDDVHWRGVWAKLRSQLGKHCLAQAQPALAIEQFAALAQHYESEWRQKAPGAAERLAFALQMLAIAHATDDAPQRALQVLVRLQQQAPLPRAQLLRLGTELHLNEHADFLALLAAADKR